MDIVEGEPLKLELESFYGACLGGGAKVVPWKDAYDAMVVASQVQKAVKESLAALEIR
jgi:hypothetical protein